MHAIDTLAAKEMLQAAGLEEKVAKAIVQVFDEAVVAGLATKADIRDVKHDLANLEARMETLVAHSKWQIVVAMAVLLGLAKAFDKFV